MIDIIRADVVSKTYCHYDLVDSDPYLCLLATISCIHVGVVARNLSRDIDMQLAQSRNGTCQRRDIDQPRLRGIRG